MKAFLFFIGVLVACALADDEYSTKQVDIPCAFHAHVYFQDSPPLRDDLEQFETYVMMNGTYAAYELRRGTDYTILIRYDMSTPELQVSNYFTQFNRSGGCYDEYQHRLMPFRKEFKYRSQEEVPCFVDDTTTCTKYTTDGYDVIYVDSANRMVGIELVNSRAYYYDYKTDVPELNMFQAIKHCDDSAFEFKDFCQKPDPTPEPKPDPVTPGSAGAASVVKSVLGFVIAAIVVALL